MGDVVLNDATSGKPAAEVGYWTAAHARGRGVAPRALNALTNWAFDTFAADGLERRPFSPATATCGYGARVPEARGTTPPPVVTGRGVALLTEGAQVSRSMQSNDVPGLRNPDPVEPLTTLIFNTLYFVASNSTHWKGR